MMSVLVPADKAANNVVVAYRLQASLSEKVVDGHGCHTALHFGVKAKETKTRFLRYTGYLNSI